jgi:ComF family protein
MAAPLAEWILELVSPSRCSACGEGATQRAAFCARCGASIGGPVRETLDGLPVLAAAPYDGPMARAVRRLKYDDHPELALPLGRFLTERVHAALPGCDLIVPVPLHPQRLSERRYNQAALLSRTVARALHIEAAPRALRRLRATAQQARLTRSERNENVCSAFSSTDAFGGRRALLLDDVVTTGATALACRQALELAGARVVAVLALAKAGPEVLAPLGPVAPGARVHPP